jgi:hypothetical protein
MQTLNSRKDLLLGLSAHSGQKVAIQFRIVRRESHREPLSIRIVLDCGDLASGDLLDLTDGALWIH